MWTCPKCGTKVDPSFEVCWKCGTTADGVEDPNFVSAEDAGPIEEPSVVPKLDDEGFNVSPERDPALVDSVECYRPRDLAEANFVVDRLTEQGIPAYYTEGLPFGTNFGPRIYVRATDLDRAHAWLEEYDREHKAHMHTDLSE